MPPQYTYTSLSESVLQQLADALQAGREYTDDGMHLYHRFFYNKSFYLHYRITEHQWMHDEVKEEWTKPFADEQAFFNAFKKYHAETGAGPLYAFLHPALPDMDAEAENIYHKLQAGNILSLSMENGDELRLYYTGGQFFVETCTGTEFQGLPITESETTQISTGELITTLKAACTIFNQHQLRSFLQ